MNFEPKMRQKKLVLGPKIGGLIKKKLVLGPQMGNFTKNKCFLAKMGGLIKKI